MENVRDGDFKFKVVFSGLCAYVPNRIVGSGKSAASWSVLLPNLRQGKTVGKNDPHCFHTVLQPHWAALRFPLKWFKPSKPAEIVFRDGLGVEHGIFLLDGERVRFGFPADQFRPNLRKVSEEEIKKKLPNPADRRSLQWAPEIDTLLKGAGSMGSGGLKLFNKQGFPARGNLSAHVLLERGTLESSSLFPPRAARGVDPLNLWEFRRRDSTAVRQQPLAYTVDLTVSARSHDPAVTLSNRKGTTRTLSLKRDSPDDVELQIMLREPEEVFDMDGGAPGFKPSDPDADFHIHYRHAGKDEEPKVSLPHLVPNATHGSGVGGSRRTCGSARFLGFDPTLKDTVDSWT